MPTGLTKDAGWQIGVSRTLPHPPALVWEFVSGREGLALWLGPGAKLDPLQRGTSYRTDSGIAGQLRGYRQGERIRLTYGSTTVQVGLTPAPGGRTVLRFHQERMACARERERQRVHWRGVVDRIAAALDG